MSRIAYVNGRYVPHGAAQVHVEDRGYQFADGVYEVVPIAGGRAVDEVPHLDRLERSLAELRIAMPISRRAFELVSRELLRRNDLRDGLIYIQVTRGVAPRNHAFPGHARPAHRWRMSRARCWTSAAPADCGSPRPAIHWWGRRQEAPAPGMRSRFRSP